MERDVNGNHGFEDLVGGHGRGEEVVGDHGRGEDLLGVMSVINQVAINGVVRRESLTWRRSGWRSWVWLVVKVW